MFVIIAGLRRLKFVFYYDDAQAKVDPDKVFVSKLTGILAVNKLFKMGVEIQFVPKDPETASRKFNFPFN